MKSKTFIAWLAAAVCGLTGWLIFINARLRSENAKLRTALASTAAHAEELSVIREQPKRDHPAPLTTTATTAHSTGLEERGKPTATSSGLAGIRALWTNPEFREASVERAITDLESRYGRFFLTLKDLSREKRDAIKTMLANQSVDLATLSFPREDPEAPDDTRNRLAAYSALQHEQAAELRTALGEEAFQHYLLAQQSEPYREMVSAIANGMRAQGLSVNDDLQEKMLSAYATAMADTARIAQHEDGKIDYSHLDSDEKIAFRERQIQRVHLQLATAMSGVLDANALDVFIATQISRDYSP